ncbi:hypothetical protein SAMN05444401_1554 [Clostridium amylolyticum]|uniref:Uncharacterized protein n=1 Tax=Clostridium amylolyticum TaxID=1121298 RepID=A0A1M6EFD3_9CLOT|nr:hypothetical protein [Clostridium amylolyticum]SHI84030.1 hypothetical protein SAMN05444401_1554 [Clostridium amylolyticum]
MKGKVIDMNKTDAFISFENGTTMDISVNNLPRHVSVGDEVDIHFSNNASFQSSTSRDRMTNNSTVDFF